MLEALKTGQMVVKTPTSSVEEIAKDGEKMFRP
jgi:hypothetical protein